MVEFDLDGLLVLSRVIDTPIGSLLGVAMSYCNDRGTVANLYELRSESNCRASADSVLRMQISQDSRKSTDRQDPRIAAGETLLDRTQEQLREYFLGDRFEFDIPFALQGTEFQMKVWSSLSQIGYSLTRTYGQLAMEIGHPRSSRAVGGTLAKNRLWIVLPCHRVVGQSGNLVGYAGGVGMKQHLLELEKKHSIG